jgi:hypothetical protein
VYESGNGAADAWTAIIDTTENPAVATAAANAAEPIRTRMILAPVSE